VLALLFGLAGTGFRLPACLRASLRAMVSPYSFKHAKQKIPRRRPDSKPLPSL
jgi:hypothetical protein